MPRVQLIHWNETEAKQRAAELRAAGYRVTHEVPRGMDFFRALRDAPPHAVMIDLSRLPMQGRDFALGIRQQKATRHIPLVFAGGEAEKVARVKQSLPDAAYASWEKIASALKQAIAHPPTNPLAPGSLLAGYSGTPLPKKLGIKPNSVVALVGAPKDFRKTLGELPAGAQLCDSANRRCNLFIWFTRSRKELAGKIKRMVVLAQQGPLWMVWPKKASGVATDLTQQGVRETGLAAGLVDYKVCAVDATWSGLLFARRKR